MRAASFLAVLAVAAPARADDTVAPVLPLVPALDRIEPTGNVAVDVGVVRADRTLLRGDFFGTLLAAPTYGFYAHLPTAFTTDDDPTTGVAGFEVGALYVAREARFTVVPHLGVVLPTASRDPAAFGLELVTAEARVDDFILALPRALSLRAGATLVASRGGLFVRVDAGVDYCVRADNTTTDLRPMWKLDAGVGYDTGVVVGALASANLAASDGGRYQTLDTVSASLAASDPALVVHPSLSVTLPIEADTRRDFTFAVTAGLAVTL